MRDKMIKSLLDNKIIIKYLDKVQPEYRDEFRQEIWLTIIEKIDKEYDRMEELYLQDKLGKFINGMISNQLMSNNSPFYTKFKLKRTEYLYDNYDKPEDNDMYIDVYHNVKKLLNILNIMDPYDAILFKLHYGINPLTNKIVKPMTYKEIATEIGLNDFQGIRNNIIKTKKIILISNRSNRL